MGLDTSFFHYWMWLFKHITCFMCNWLKEIYFEFYNQSVIIKDDQSTNPVPRLHTRPRVLKTHYIIHVSLCLLLACVVFAVVSNNSFQYSLNIINSNISSNFIVFCLKPQHLKWNVQKKLASSYTHTGSGITFLFCVLKPVWFISQAGSCGDSCLDVISITGEGGNKILVCNMGTWLVIQM